MAKRTEEKIKCDITLTPGADKRLAAALFELNCRIENGEIEGPSLKKERKKEQKKGSA